MVVRHASLCVPSVPFPLCPTYLSLFVYLSLHSRPPHSGAPFARLESRSPTIPSESRFDAERGCCSRVEISDKPSTMISAPSSSAKLFRSDVD